VKAGDVNGVLYSLTTDEGAVIEHTPSAAFSGDADDRKRWRDGDTTKLDHDGAHRVDDPDINKGTANCHGTVFDRGKSHIAEDQVRIIVRDNYTAVNAKATDPKDKQKAKVCDIVIYADPASARHTALIVEVDENGDVKTVVGKNGTHGEVWAHPPDNFGTDWEVWRRNEDKFDADQRAKLDRLRKDYDEAKAKYAGNKSNANRDGLHKAGMALCQEKNALKSKP
jgi:hypothetical protein